MTSVEVLLATRNSARYLPELLDSLLQQTHPGFRLIVSDDASEDETISILEQFAPRFGRRMTVVERTTPSGSASANFNFLMALSTARYVLLADHDDIWKPDKIEVAVRRLQELERQHGEATPLLAHTDLELIDGEGRPLPRTLWHLKSIDPAFGTRLNTALMHATVTGCASAMNRALVQRAMPIPQDAVMHDWWLNLVGAAFGHIDFSRVPTIRYRIHGENVSRPQEVSARAALRHRNPASKVRANLGLRARQARALLERFDGALESRARDATRACGALPAVGPLGRRVALVRHRLFYPGIWRNAALLLLA